jgi:23S rRNA pseudouridine1911/1915/1917 synthase
LAREVVPSALGGERLDRVVSLLTGCSRSEASALIVQGAVAVDGRVVTIGKSKIAEGQVIQVDEDALPGERQPSGDAAMALQVVHEDPDFVVIEKPAGLIVHPGAGHHTGTLVNGLLARYPEIAAVGAPTRPGIVHRLDKDTTGLLVVARTEQAYSALVDALTRREVERIYLALVWGEPRAPRGVIDAPLGRSRRQTTRVAVQVEGKDARTRYEVQQVYRHPARSALVECRLETGRTHQIRVHLAAIGHPVVGDRDYGGARSGLPAKRPLLHAHRLSFAHPRRGQLMTFESPMPDDMAAVLAMLS